jgi:hypothetical protein
MSCALSHLYLNALRPFGSGEPAARRGHGSTYECSPAHVSQRLKMRRMRSSGTFRAHTGDAPLKRRNLVADTQEIQRRDGYSGGAIEGISLVENPGLGRRER